MKIRNFLEDRKRDNNFHKRLVGTKCRITPAFNIWEAESKDGCCRTMNGSAKDVLIVPSPNSEEFATPLKNLLFAHSVGGHRRAF